MDSRGISPTVGVVLLVAIGVTMATIAAVAVLDISQEREPRPSVTLDLEVTEDGATHVLVHEAGEALDGDKTTIRGGILGTDTAGQRFGVHDEIRLYPVENNVSLVYTGEHGTTYVLNTFEAETTVPEPDVGCDWVSDQTDDGSNSITVDRVVDCDIDTDGQVTVQSNGAVYGQVTSNGDITVQGAVYEAVTAGGTVDLDGADVYADIDASDDVTVEDSVVSGGIQTDGTLDCTNSTVDGESCREYGSGGGTGATGGVAFTQDGALTTLASNGSAPTDWGIGGVRAVGPQTVDFDGDGATDIPYLPNASSLMLVDSNDGSPRETDIGGAQADTQKTALAVGSWDGSSTSVFYTGEDHDTIYRVTPGGSPVAIATPDNGVNVVLGPGDIDGDGAAELAFADGSQTIRYVQPDGTIDSTGETAGSSNNIGASRPVDLDGDGTATVPIVDGSNQILLVDADGIDETIITGSDDEQAAKSHVAVADIDDDGVSEIVYLENNDSPADLRYVDDVGGSNTFESVYDDSGDRIPGDKKRGVTT
jgi:FlaG/FlaF family flagellin (archaellin)